MANDSDASPEHDGLTQVGFAVMTVCTMNICRSPAMEYVLERDMAPLTARFGITLDVSSAGTHAVAGAPSCDISLAMVGLEQRTETARCFDQTGPERPDLILCAARSHVSAVAAVDPRLRNITFTLLQAARLARWVVTEGVLDMGLRKLAGEAIEEDRTQFVTLTPALPAQVGQRLKWLIAEMDAARGIAPMPPEMPEPHHGDDIPDPHVLGYNLHRMSADLILDSMTILNQSAACVLSA